MDLQADVPSIDISAEVFDAMQEGRVMFAMEPVRSTEDRNKELYRECVARVVDRRGRILPAREFVPALEASGLIRQLDRYVMRRVIGLLRENPSLNLGINVSGSGAMLDVVWESMFIGLVGTPSVARRLIVEIPEAAALECGHGRRFLNRLGHMGCQLAIDDYGVAYGVETAIEIPHPDIVKIDASFLAGIRGGVFGVQRLAKMVSLAADIARCVVVQGVEDETDFKLAREAGAEWAQGDSRQGGVRSAD